jgi:hypothetical protein
MTGKSTRCVRAGIATLAAMAVTVAITAAATADAVPATKPNAALTGASVVDLSWLNATTGWALAAEPCAQTLCPRVARTDDGGRSWTDLPSPPAKLTGAGCTHLPCVGHIRFATPTIGYLFGPSLLVTHDGGHSWTRVPGPQVESLEPGSGTVIRIVYDHSGCPGPCDRSVEVAAPGSSSWGVLLAPLPQSSAGPEEAVTARLIRTGSHTVYIALYGNLANGANASQHTAIHRSLNAGRSWTRLPDPCGGSGPSERDAIDLAAAPGGVLAAICAKRFGQPTTFSVITSSDSGTAWSPRHPLPASADYPDLIRRRPQHAPDRQRHGHRKRPLHLPRQPLNQRRRELLDGNQRARAAQPELTQPRLRLPGLPDPPHRPLGRRPPSHLDHDRRRPSLDEDAIPLAAAQSNRAIQAGPPPQPPNRAPPPRARRPPKAAEDTRPPQAAKGGRKRQAPRPLTVAPEHRAAGNTRLRGATGTPPPSPAPRPACPQAAKGGRGHPAFTEPRCRP